MTSSHPALPPRVSSSLILGKPTVHGKAVAPSENEDDYDFEDFDNEDEVSHKNHSEYNQ